jgi:hypothetical protein
MYSERVFHPQFGFGSVVEPIVTIQFPSVEMCVVRFDIPANGEREYRVLTELLEPESIRIARFDGTALAADLAARLAPQQVSL